MKKTLSSVIVIGLHLGCLGGRGEALPMFARKYGTSCVTCHEAFPRLNATGETFRLNGYRFADDEDLRKEEPLELGDEAYKKRWPETIWPSDMPGGVPIAVRLTNDVSWDLGGVQDNSHTTFNLPSSAAVFGAGSLGDRMSFFTEFGWSRTGVAGAAGHGHGGGAAAAEEGEVEFEGWLQFEDLFEVTNAFNLRAGSVGMHELGLFTARDHNRISVNRYLYSSWTMPSPSTHNIEDVVAGITDHDDVDFDGNPFTMHAQPGIELNGFGRKWRYAVGVLNGNGENRGDNNREKDAYFQFAFKPTGKPLDGSESKGSSGRSDHWSDDSVILSTFGYWGDHPVMVERKADKFDESRNDRFWRLGAGALVRTGRFQFGGGYVWGNNEKPFGVVTENTVGQPEDVDSRSYFGEVTWFAHPFWVPYARYEALDLDLPPAVRVGMEATWPRGADQRRWVVGSKMLVGQNVSVAAEGRFYTDNLRKGEENDEDQLIARAELVF